MYYNAKLIEKIKETETTYRFFFEVIGVDFFNFTPGQFISFEFPIDEKQSKRIRHYSIASAPEKTNKFEIIIVKKNGGKGTDWLWKQDIGVEIPFTGPSGILVMDDNKKKNHIFICTGTGIAPFRSMLLDIKNNNTEVGDLILLFGTRDRENMLYFKEMFSLEEELKSFKFLPILSRELFLGRQGYVHILYKDIINDYFKQMEENTYNDLDICFYICGWKEMVKEARKNLLDIGFDKKQIKQEIYE